MSVIATLPGAPTIGVAVAGDAQATVGFTPPASDGGSPVTGYTTQYGQTGAGWLRPTGVLVGRIIKIVYQLNF